MQCLIGHRNLSVVPVLLFESDAFMRLDWYVIIPIVVLMFCCDMPALYCNVNFESPLLISLCLIRFISELLTSIVMPRQIKKNNWSRPYTQKTCVKNFYQLLQGTVICSMNSEGI